MVSRTPVFFVRKGQAAVEIIMYGAELYAIKTKVGEVQSVIYWFRCLGVKVKDYSLICGDNRGFIQNITFLNTLFKKMLILPIKGKERHLKWGLLIQSRSQEKATFPVF